MKVTALLSWFDERPDDLHRAITSHAGAGVLDAVVALDGRYRLYGSGTCVSSAAEYDAIRTACDEHGLGLTLADRVDPWPGEVAKRAHLFGLAAVGADPARDWVWVIDADNELTEHPGADRFRAELAGTPEAVVAVTFSEPGRLIDDTRRPMRQIFRALPGLTAYGRHWHYAAKVGGEWAYLWGPGERQVRAHELPEVVVRHHSSERADDRRAAARDYYAARDLCAVEVSPSWWITDETGALAAVDNEGELA